MVSSIIHRVGKFIKANELPRTVTCLCLCVTEENLLFRESLDFSLSKPNQYRALYRWNHHRPPRSINPRRFHLRSRVSLPTIIPANSFRHWPRRRPSLFSSSPSSSSSSSSFPQESATRRFPDGRLRSINFTLSLARLKGFPRRCDVGTSCTRGHRG